MAAGRAVLPRVLGLLGVLAYVLLQMNPKLPGRASGRACLRHECRAQLSARIEANDVRTFKIEPTLSSRRSVLPAAAIQGFACCACNTARCEQFLDSLQPSCQKL
eukprot:5366062-Pleurochrysis_carterae.AAC.3